MSKVDYRKIRWGEDLPSDWKPPKALKLIHDIRHKMDKEIKGMKPIEMEECLSKNRRCTLEMLGYKMFLTEDGRYELVKIDRGKGNI